MKKDIHPPYQQVLFVDSSNGVKFICGSAVETDQTEVYEGQEYPVVHISVSSASHPFFTGSNKFIDTEGRVDKFLKRYAKKEKPKKEEDKEEPKATKSKTKKAKK